MKTVAALVLALALTACTGTPEEQPAATTTAARPSPTPSPSASQVVLRGPNDRHYIVRTAADRTDVEMHGGTNEPVRETFAIPGRYVLPQVVPGGPLEGLSPDGRRLVLESHQQAPERSVFLVLTDRLRVERASITLPGHLTFDAWSPTGDVLYLIEHQAPADSGHYAVRAYDMRAQTLRPGPIADKREIGEQMAGRPVARATTPDAAVVATLYVRQGDGDEHGPFVHLLYAADGQALCVDLPEDTKVGPGWGLSRAGSGFVVTSAPGRPAFRIDATSGELTRSR